MANRTIQDYNSSGECNEIKIGGIEDINKARILGDTGMMSFRNTGDILIPLTTAFSKVDIFDTVDVDSARGHMNYDNTLKRLTINTAGVYQFSADGSFQLANNVDIEFTFYLNGIIVQPDTTPVFTGLGNKNVAMSANRMMALAVDDYLEIWAKVGSDNTVTMKSSYISVEKTTY